MDQDKSVPVWVRWLELIKKYNLDLPKIGDFQANETKEIKDTEETKEVIYKDKETKEVIYKANELLDKLIDTIKDKCIFKTFI